MNLNDVLIGLNVIIIVGYLVYWFIKKKKVIKHQKIIKSDEKES